MTDDVPIAYETIYPDEGKIFASRPETTLTYSPGDVVTTPRGTGVVNGVLVDHFNFPQSDGDDEYVRATESMPGYIVGFGGRSAPFRKSTLDDGDLQRPRDPTEGDAIVSPIAEHPLRGEEMESEWHKRDLLSWWSNVDGLWRNARDYLTEGGMDTEEAESVASKRKDALLGTKRWRTRF